MHSFIHLFTDVYIYTHCMCVWYDDGVQGGTPDR